MCMSGIAGGKIYILKQLKKHHQLCLEVPEAARGFPPSSSTATVQALSLCWWITLSNVYHFRFPFLTEVDNLSCTFYVLISLFPHPFFGSACSSLLPIFFSSFVISFFFFWFIGILYKSWIQVFCSLHMWQIMFRPSLGHKVWKDCLKMLSCNIF